MTNCHSLATSMTLILHELRLIAKLRILRDLPPVSGRQAHQPYDAKPASLIILMTPSPPASSSS